MKFQVTLFGIFAALMTVSAQLSETTTAPADDTTTAVATSLPSTTVEAATTASSVGSTEAPTTSAPSTATESTAAAITTTLPPTATETPTIAALTTTAPETNTTNTTTSLPSTTQQQNASMSEDLSNNRTDTNNATKSVRTLDALLTVRSEIKIDEPCDVKNNTQKCGVQAYCLPLTGCQTGVCTCRPGFRQDKSSRDHPWDCTAVFAINAKCDVNTDPSRQLFPDGAFCSPTTKTVVCERAVESGPCSTAEALASLKKGFAAYAEPCDSKTADCNAAFGHVCSIRPGAAAVNASRCMCPQHLRKSANSDICVPVEYDQPCDENVQCLHLYGSNSVASVCSKETKRCVCNTETGYSPVNFMRYVGANAVNVTRCALTSLLRASVNKTCTVGYENTYGNNFFCTSKLTCQRCPEFETSAIAGRCVESAISSATAISYYMNASILAAIFCLILMMNF